MGSARTIQAEVAKLRAEAEADPPEVANFDQAIAKANTNMSLFRKRMTALANTRGGAATLAGPLPGVSGDASVIRSAFGV
jgi:hypothetical protein